ncbi:MAG: response regulator transcription factor [Miniphocaeibacter sp.]|jgi:DNA-binding response OmpR family regulator|uniref:response regulator transcription factor n=1 Tax=Miniphocaeibacter sp. TaxID=3100973 RepID=UPI0017B99671|nr:response regulator transcription factor [Gallicola sp.]
MENKRVLIIEDDVEINILLSKILEDLGVVSTSAYSGTEGLLQFQTGKFDLILLDLMLPGINGEEFLRELREISSVPVIIISAKSTLDDKVGLLRLGADDYITKPFAKEEVKARVEVQLRRGETTINKEENILIWKDLKLDKKQRIVKLKENSMDLTISEFDILQLLMENPKRVFSKRDIFEKIGKGLYLGDDNTISVHISNIRKKFLKVTKDEYIKTVWGIGFILD